jgi:hypothetical protein
VLFKSERIQMPIMALEWKYLDLNKKSALIYSREFSDSKRTPWPLVRKGTIPTERLPLVDEI